MKIERSGFLGQVGRSYFDTGLNAEFLINSPDSTSFAPGHIIHDVLRLLIGYILKHFAFRSPILVANVCKDNAFSQASAPRPEMLRIFKISPIFAGVFVILGHKATLYMNGKIRIGMGLTADVLTTKEETL